MRRLVAASAILAALLTLPLATASATPQASPAVTPAVTDSDRATAALEYLLAAQHPDGSIDASIGETADFVIGAAAAGYDPATLHGCAAGSSALDFIATASDAAATDASKTGKAILAVVAAGGDPANFQGRDLVKRLEATYTAATGQYGDGSTFGESFAILALKAAGKPVPDAAVGELKALQDTDGSWSYGTAPVAAGNGDTNSTAIALMALDAAGDKSADAAGLAYLATQQLDDGGFPYQNSSAFGPPASDPDSDSIVLQALIAAGQNPEGPAWTRGSATVLTQLRGTQAASGGFAYPGMAPNAFTTSQVPAALMSVPYGSAVHPTAGKSLPASACSSPSPSPSPSPTAAATATATVRPTPKPTPRRTARPTARPTTRPTSQPVATATPSPESAATDTAAPTETPSATPVPNSVVAGATATSGPAGPANDSGSSGGLPTPILYGLAGLAALLVVAGAGWLLMFRPRTQ